MTVFLTFYEVFTLHAQNIPPFTEMTWPVM